ncbi:MAG: DUF1565 domain-containing protein [Dokdonella sp.]
MKIHHRMTATCALLFVVPIVASAAAPISAYDHILAYGFESIPTYYVATTGDNANAGTRAFPWKTIQYAVGDSSPAPAGSVIYVAAGNYDEQVTVAKDGLSLIGYKAEPGDQPRVLANVPIDMNNANPFPTFDPAEMPLLDHGDRASGFGFLVQGRQNLTIRNFNIRNYAYGVSAGNADRNFAENLSLDNVNVSTVGDTAADYSGLGIALGSMSTSFSNGGYVHNALIINAAAEGFKISGDNNVAQNIRVYSTEPDGNASTDYYLILTGSYNVVRDSLIWRWPFSDHSGHGYTIKDNADQLVGGPLIKPMHNLFQNNVAINMGEGYAVRHRGVQQNTFLDNAAYGTYPGVGNCGNGNGIMIRDGASANLFKNTTIANTCTAIDIGDSVEDGGSLETPPFDNVIENAQVNTTYVGVGYLRDNPSVPNSDAGNNVITGSSFVLARYMFYAEHPSQQMHYADTHFSGTADVDDEGYFRGGPYGGDVVPAQFTNCTFEKFPGGMPPGF